MVCSINIETCVSPPLDIDQGVLSTRIEVEHEIQSHPIIECYVICEPHLKYEDFVLSDGQVFMTINLQHFKVKKQDDYGIYK